MLDKERRFPQWSFQLNNFVRVLHHFSKISNLLIVSNTIIHFTLDKNTLFDKVDLN